MLDTFSLQERLDELQEEAENGRWRLTPDDSAELKELEALKDSLPEWECNETLIPEGEFVEYAQQLASDLGCMENADSWPSTHIDWDAAANDLKNDYYEIEYQGETYLVRS